MLAGLFGKTRNVKPIPRSRPIDKSVVNTKLVSALTNSIVNSMDKFANLSTLFLYR